VLLFSSLVASPDEAVQEVLHFTENAQTIVISLSAFIGTGLGGAVLAWKKIQAEWRKRDEPTGRGGKERAQVQAVREAVEKETKAREDQHKVNSSRLEQMQHDLDALREDSQGTRRLVERILSTLLEQK
jgi:hypothetical protein